ncbi:MAG TPA: HNH endonuclease family protein [Acidimicrobiales bacterium]|jgi:hypothetical protein|nr:HNH endonuclease family protein [Acidimicrobiales bacterium]
MLTSRSRTAWSKHIWALAFAVTACTSSESLAAQPAVTAANVVDATTSTASTPANDQAPTRDVGETEHATMTLDGAASTLSELVLADRVRTGYSRDEFGDGWRTTGGCTTRERVLIAESIRTAVTGPGCENEGGEWHDWYRTGSPVIDDASTLDIDHMVPLRQAWQAGAWAWTDQQRSDYANDLVHPWTLTAVSASQNRAKSDSPPDAWQPPNKAARCQYAKDWIAVKADWRLTVTVAETDALRHMLETC